MGDRSNRLRSALTVSIAMFLVMLSVLPGSASSRYRVISRDPYTNADSFHETEVEPATFAVGSRIMAAFQMGRFEDEGASNLGFAYSADAGRTWTGGALPSTTIHADPPGPYAWASEPSVTYSAKQGVWLITGVGENTYEEVFVSRSLDARTWEPPITVSEPAIFPPVESSRLACDNWLFSPYYGNCYLKWDEQFQLYASVSHDGGLTWEPSQTPQDWYASGGDMVVQPNGRVVMAVGDDVANRCCTYNSRDGGISFNGPHFLRSVGTHTVAGNLRAVESLSLSVDDHGRLYLTAFACEFRPSCRTNDVILTRSRDGVSWGAWRRVPIDSIDNHADHFLPAISVEPGTSGGSAQLAITYWSYANSDCTETTCRLSVGMIRSPDGGLTWGKAVSLAGPFSNTWLPLTSQGYMVGDYSAISFVDGRPIAVFAAAQPSACRLGQNDCRVAMAAPAVP